MERMTVTERSGTFATIEWIKTMNGKDNNQDKHFPNHGLCGPFVIMMAIDNGRVSGTGPLIVNGIYPSIVDFN